MRHKHLIAGQTWCECNSQAFSQALILNHSINMFKCINLDIAKYLLKDFKSNILYLLSSSWPPRTRHNKQTDMISPIIREGELSQRKSVWSEAVWQKTCKGTK